MLKKALLVAAFAISPLIMSENASAHCAPGHGGYGGYPVYRAPVVVHRVPHHVHHYRSSFYRAPYRSYGLPYRYAPRPGFGYGYGHPYYGRGTSFGVGRGGISFRIGF